MMFRPELVPYLLNTPVSLLHDRWVSLVGSVLGGGVAVKEIISDYRIHGAQAVGVAEGRISAKVTRAVTRWTSPEVWLAELAALDTLSGIAPAKHDVIKEITRRRRRFLEWRNRVVVGTLRTSR
jgi:hypothetical protein